MPEPCLGAIKLAELDCVRWHPDPVQCQLIPKNLVETMVHNFFRRTPTNSPAILWNQKQSSVVHSGALGLENSNATVSHEGPRDVSLQVLGRTMLQSWHWTGHTELMVTRVDWFNDWPIKWLEFGVWSLRHWAEDIVKSNGKIDVSEDFWDPTQIPQRSSWTQHLEYWT